MIENNDIYYKAILNRDYNFDGYFYTGIPSTKIYCRPICKSRTPKEENCKYFKSAAEAEWEGFRPCLKCRPEIAPKYRTVDLLNSPAYQLARLIEKKASYIKKLEDIYDKLGYKKEYLREVFIKEYNISPEEYLLTSRLHLAKMLLTDAGLQLSTISMATGFNSKGELVKVFEERYRMDIFKIRKSSLKKYDYIILKLSYRPPYLWDKILKFFELRAISGVELIKDNAYYRTIQIITKEKGICRGWIKVKNIDKNNIFEITISNTLLPVLSELLFKIREAFDLDNNPALIEKHLYKMNHIKNGLFHSGTRVPGCFDIFEMSVRGVLGQQITIKAASTITSRLNKKFGSIINIDIDGLNYIFPTAEDIMELGDNIIDELGYLGIIRRRSETILTLANMIGKDEIDFEMNDNPKEKIEKLMKIPGIGPWTANYIAMRGLKWSDAFLETDYGIRKGLDPMTKKEIIKLSENWKPYRAYAAFNIWNSL